MPWIVFKFCEKCETIQKQFNKTEQILLLLWIILCGFINPKWIYIILDRLIKKN